MLCNNKRGRSPVRERLRDVNGGLFGSHNFRYESSPTRTRTLDIAVNSRSLYQLSYRGMSDSK